MKLPITHLDDELRVPVGPIIVALAAVGLALVLVTASQSSASRQLEMQLLVFSFDLALGLLASDPFGDRVAFVEPGCDPAGETATAQRLVVSSTGRPDEREIVAQARSAGCAFSMLRWLPPPVERPQASYSPSP